MSISVQYDQFTRGVTLRKGDGSVLLNAEGFLRLIDVLPQIDVAVEAADVTDAWTLYATPSFDVRASVSVFRDQTFIHVRMWTGSHPSKNGVCYTAQEWSFLKAFLHEDSELGCAVKAYAEIIRAKTAERMAEDCDACEIDDPSQANHSCLMGEKEPIARMVAQEVFVNQTPAHMIFMMAKEAKKCNVVLKAPYDALVLCSTVLKEKIVSLSIN